MSNVRSAEFRKSGRDGKPTEGKPFTPSEQRRKNKLMRQFLLDGPKGASAEYRANYDSINWGEK